MFLRNMTRFQPLRDGEGEGGSGASGGSPDVSALEARNRALEERLARQEAQINQITTTSQQNAEQQQIEAAKSRVAQAIADAGSAVDVAERELAEAHEEGDGAKIAKAQRTLSEAAAKRERVNAEADSFKRQLADSEKRQGGSRTAASGGGDLDTSNLDSWKDRNKEWYGIDQEMTRAAHELDSSVRAAGTFKTGSTEYFQAIDRAMKQRFPDRFAGAPASGGARGEGNSGGSSKPRRYSESIQRGMNAFGMSAEQWDNARQTAVSKGLLPAEPVTGRIIG